MVVVGIVLDENTCKASDALPAHQMTTRDGDRIGRNMMVRELIQSCGFAKKLKLIDVKLATFEQVCEFHDEDYIETFMNWKEKTDKELKAYNLENDSYPFPFVENHAFWIAGASISAAEQLVQGNVDVAINWFGGRHHAHRAKASGFCFVNDVVLSILCLQKAYKKILCIDIDVHHGDGTEEAFYYSNKVYTVSFHQYHPGFFPGTGNPDSKGKGRGKGFNKNVVFQPNTDGQSYVDAFKLHVGEVLKSFQPDAIVLVCGADTLKHDPRGDLNLYVKNIADCVKYVKRWVDESSTIGEKKIPLLVLGAGGYYFAETSKCYTIITALLLGNCKLPHEIPEHQYFEEYGPFFSFF